MWVVSHKWKKKITYGCNATNPSKGGHGARLDVGKAYNTYTPLYTHTEGAAILKQVAGKWLRQQLNVNYEEDGSMAGAIARRGK